MVQAFRKRLAASRAGGGPRTRDRITSPGAPPSRLEGRYSLEIGQFSDTGCVRKRNEDSIAVAQPATADKKRPGLLAIVADGMGGHQAGDKASQLAVDVIRQTFAASDAAPDKALAEAFQAANRAILNEASHDPALTGMGTTATALAIVDGRGWLAHVGDSRLFRLRNGRLEQLSEDHTLIAAMLRDGLVTPQQARDHPNRHVLSRAMGTHPSLDVMLAPVGLALGDAYLLCSDGLHDLVDAGEIRDCLIERPPQAACAFLVELARRRGGYDNISVIAVACGRQPGATSAPRDTRDTVHHPHD